jgi:hypothetical protein
MFAEERKQRHFEVAECQPLDCPDLPARTKNRVMARGSYGVNRRLSLAPDGNRTISAASPYLFASSSRRLSSISRLSPNMKVHSLPRGSPGSGTTRVDEVPGRPRTDEIRSPFSKVILSTKPRRTTVGPFLDVNHATTGVDSFNSLLNRRAASSREIVLVFMMGTIRTAQERRWQGFRQL